MHQCIILVPDANCKLFRQFIAHEKLKTTEIRQYAYTIYTTYGIIENFLAIADHYQNLIENCKYYSKTMYRRQRDGLHRIRFQTGMKIRFAPIFTISNIILLYVSPAIYH